GGRAPGAVGGFARVEGARGFGLAAAGGPGPPVGVAATLATGHIQQDLADLMEDQPEEAVDGLRASRLQGGDQAHPELADDALQVMTTAQGGKVLLEDRGGDPYQAGVGPFQQFPRRAFVASVEAVD